MTFLYILFFVHNLSNKKLIVKDFFDTALFFSAKNSEPINITLIFFLSFVWLRSKMFRQFINKNCNVFK